MKLHFLSTALLALATESSWTHAKKDEMTANANVRRAIKAETPKERILAADNIVAQYVGGPVAIPDNGVLTNNFAIVTATSTEVCSIADVNILVDIVHTWIGDLVIKLEHPDGTVVDITPANRAAGLGSANDMIAGTFTTFDDSATVSSVSINVDGGTWYSAGLDNERGLTTLNGKSASGTWKLYVGDEAVLDNGQVLQFQVQVICDETTDSPSAAPSDSPSTILEGCFNCPDVDGKVTICHRGEVPVTIEIGYRALDAHCENHPGDSCGVCPE